MKEIFNSFKSTFNNNNQQLIENFIFDINNKVEKEHLIKKYNIDDLDDSLTPIRQIEDSVHLILRVAVNPEIELSLKNYTDKDKSFKTTIIYNILKDTIELKFSIYSDYKADIFFKMVFCDTSPTNLFDKGVFLVEAKNPYRVNFKSSFPYETEDTYISKFQSPKLFEVITRYVEQHTTPIIAKEMLALEYDLNINDEEIMSRIHENSVLIQSIIKQKNTLHNKLI